jgi:hypothetical protein
VTASRGGALTSVPAHAAIVALAFLAGYAIDVGGGFIKEDALWILRSRIETPADLSKLITDTGGFFRPVVALSFAANYWMFGSNPLGYGWTNLVLAAGAALAVFSLARALTLSPAASALAGSLWILNFHGINMAVLWLSGRTALLLVVFAVLAAVAAARDRPVVACAFAFLAMASKEEGVLLPVVLIALVCLRPDRAPVRRGIAFTAGLIVVTAVYAALRTASNADTPINAPAFYRFTLSLDTLRTNIVEYADRALTLPAIVTIIALAVAGRRPALDRRHRRLIGLAALWFVLGFGLTVFLPVRSSLYVLFPSVGAVLAAAIVVERSCDGVSSRRMQALAALAFVLPLTFVPIYWARNDRWSELGDISRQVVAAFRELAVAAPPRWEVVMIDSAADRSNIAAALGWAVPDVVELTTGKRPRVWITPPPPELGTGWAVMAPSTADAILALSGKAIVRVPASSWKPALAGEFQ